MAAETSPSDLLETGHFHGWYPGQRELLLHMLEWYYSPARFLGLPIPTGQGKSLSGLLLAKLTGARTVILTATKGLSHQYLTDAAPLGGVEVEGRNNFRCLLDPNITAEDGICNLGIGCDARDECPYRLQLSIARNSRLVVTNYAYWLAQTNYAAGLGKADLLIADEAHLAFGALEGFLTVFLSRSDMQPLGISFPETGSGQWEGWRLWAESSAVVMEREAGRLKADVNAARSRGETAASAAVRAARRFASLTARLKLLSGLDEQWIVQRTPHGRRFVPKWVAQHSADLFHAAEDVPKVVLMSAILSHRSADYLGVPNDGRRAWVEADSAFPAENTPIYHVDTARINYRTTSMEMTLWVSRIDQIIQRRLDRKGIIFTVSYERAKLLLSRSRFKDIMITHSTQDVMRAVELFKSSSPPVVLVSPSVSTGYDFPQAECLVPGTLVRTLKGYKVIESIEVGDMVMSHKGRFQRVTAVHSRHYDGDVCDIETYGAYRHSLTPEHLVLSGNGWLEADSVVAGSVIVYPVASSWLRANGRLMGAKRLGCKYVSGHANYLRCGKVPKSWSETTDFWRLVGIWAAEGHIGKEVTHRKGGGHPTMVYRVVFDFNVKELSSLAEDTCSLIESVLGNRRPRPFITHRNGCRVMIKNKPFAGWLSKNVGLGSNNKRVPPRLVYTSTDADKVAFSTGVLDGDGYYGAGHWDLGVTSEQLALGVRDLLLTVGCPAVANKMSSKDVWRTRTVAANGHAEIVKRKRGMQLPDGTFCLLSKVRSVSRRHYSGIVHNLSVNYDESYSLVGLSVHNCGFGKSQYIVIGKLPYPDTSDPVTRARHEDDKDWSSYMAMETLIQSCGRMSRCLSWDTQILTRDGWRGPDDIREGDMVYSLLGHNLRGGSTRVGGFGLGPVRGVHAWDSDSCMVRVLGRSLDLLVTPDHELIVQPYNEPRNVRYKYRNRRVTSRNVGIKRSGLVKCRADALPVRFKVAVSGHCQRDRRRGVLCSRKMSERDDWMFLMGLIISDGYFSKRGNRNHVKIVQSTAKSDICDAISSVLERLGLKHKVDVRQVAGTSVSIGGGKSYVRNGEHVQWCLSGLESVRIKRLFAGGPWGRLPEDRQFVRKSIIHAEKTIPLWVLQECRKRELLALLRGLMAGDGTWHTGFTSGTYYTSNKELADRVQYLLVLSDYRSHLRMRRGSSYEIQFLDNQFVEVTRDNVSTVPYTGKTWCVSVDLGTIVVRRNGCVAIVSNSAQDKCEVLIIDDNWKWFIRRHGKFAPSWFKARCRGSLNAVPNPLV